MIKSLKYHYTETIDKIKINVVTLRPYLERVQKASLSFSLRLVIVIIVIIAVIWFGKCTWKHITSQSVFTVNPVTFSFEAPDWATDKLVSELKNIPGLKEKYNMFEKGLTGKIAGLYEKSPFISKVHYVERELPNRLNLKFELRRPIAIVKRKNKEYLVDKDCVRLPPKYYKYPEGGNPIYMVCNKSTNIPGYGEKWDDRPIEEGLGLLNYLKYNRIDKLLKIVTLDVSNVARKPETGKSNITLWTEKGTMIKWGCPLSCEKPNELSNYEKLQNLLSVAKEEGPNLANMEYVDLRWKTPLGKHVNIQR